MRLLILVVLGFALAAAFPQNEERSRVRGIRRFSLATPGLQAGRISENEVVNDLGEEKTEVAEGSEPRTRSRGTSLLRRGHPSRRLIGRPNSETQEPTAEITEAVEDTSAKVVANGRDGLRIRRPLKKPTTIVIATTTTLPVAEEIASESVAQTLVSTTLASSPLTSEAGIIEEGMLTEESKPIMKDEIMHEPKDMKDTVLAQDQNSEIADGSNIEDPVIHKSELKSQTLPRPKKLRPIPIKLGRRGQGEADQQSPVEVTVSENQEQASDNQASSHRFASRSRPALQSRRRPLNRQANQQVEAQQPAVEETETPTEEEPAKTRTRSRVPVLSRQPGRGPTPARRRIAQPENVAEESPLPIDDSANPLQEPETRFQDVTELQLPINQEITTSSHKQARIRPRIKNSSSQTQDELHNTRTETGSALPEIEAPISDSVRKGRPPKISLDSSVPELHTQTRTTGDVKSKFPTPHYGGSDLVYKAGEVQVTQIGTIEDTPTEQVRQILSGLGSKRRGLSRPPTGPSRIIKETPDKKTISSQPDTPSTNQELQTNIDFLYDYYEQ